MSTKSAALKTQRTSKHGRVPGSGAVRITEHSGLRKLMRASRRGKVPTERKRIMVEAIRGVLARPQAFENRLQREARRNAAFAIADYVPSDPPVTVDLSIHGSKPNPDPASLVGLSC